MNFILKLDYIINTFPDKINWKSLSELECLTINIIDKNINKDWDFNKLSKNPSISEMLIEKYPNKPWNYKEMIHNSSISIDFINKFITNKKDLIYYINNSFCGCIITENFIEKNINDLKLLNLGKHVSLQFVEKYNDKIWNWNEFILNDKFNIKFANKFLDKYVNTYEGLKKIIDLNLIVEKSDDIVFVPNEIYNKDYGIDYLLKYVEPKYYNTDLISSSYKLKSSNIKFMLENNYPINFDKLNIPNCLPISLLNKYRDKPWNWEKITESYCLYEKKNLENFIETFNDKPLNWNRLTKNENVNIKIIMKFPDKLWDWKNVTNYMFYFERYVPLKFIENNIHKDWNWDIISTFSYLTIKFIEENIDKPFNFSLLSCHSYIPLTFIEKYINKDWDINNLILYNPNITNEFINNFLKIKTNICIDIVNKKLKNKEIQNESLSKKRIINNTKKIKDEINEKAWCNYINCCDIDELKELESRWS